MVLEFQKFIFNWAITN